MQRNSVHIEPVQVGLDQRSLVPRNTCAVAPSRGFFTLGFAVVVLAAGALVAGAGGALNVSEGALAPAPGAAVVQSGQPVDKVDADGARTVLIGEALARSPDDASDPATPQQ
jgi:hypothetical protein